MRRRHYDHDAKSPFAVPFPTTLGDARRLIRATFAKNKWDDQQERFYMNAHGVRPQPIEQLGREDAHKILTDMGKSHMIIFEKLPAASPEKAVGALAA